MPPVTATGSTQKLQGFGTTIIATAAAIALLYYGRALCITLVVAIIIAFILEPFVVFFMRLRLPRAVASFVVCSIALMVVYLLGLGVYVQVSSLSEELPAYSNKVNELVDSVADRLDRAEQNAYRLLVPKRFQEKAAATPEQPPPVRRRGRTQPPPQQQPQPPTVQEVRIQREKTSIVSWAYGYVSSFYNVLLMISFVPFLVYFILSWRDHLRRVYLSMFQGPERVIAGRTWEGIATIARAYVSGNFLLGLLLSVASCIVFFSWHLPYWTLIGPLSGFLSLVPYVGMPLAILPPIVAALPMYPNVTPYLVIAATVAFLHLLALNLLYPMIVGSRVHLNPLSVTVALMFWGTIWGAIGLVLAIPITAGAKAVFDNIESLQPYGRLLGD